MLVYCLAAFMNSASKIIMIDFGSPRLSDPEVHMRHQRQSMTWHPGWDPGTEKEQYVKAKMIPKSMDFK